MPMNREVDIESEIQEVAEEVDLDGPFVPGIKRTDIEDVSEFGDFEYYAWERYYNHGKSQSTISSFSMQSQVLKNSYRNLIKLTVIQ